MELSRRCGCRFLLMMNRETLDEGYRVAVWWLQRFGEFSVERGCRHNEEGKQYAVEVEKRDKRCSSASRKGKSIT